LAINRLGKRELAPVSRHLNNREDSLLIPSRESSIIPQETTMLQTTYDDKIIDFEVLEHYMTVLQERNNLRQLKGNLTSSLTFQ
jgi:hypothetical protein